MHLCVDDAPVLNLALATSQSITFEKPDGTVVVQPAELADQDGTDGDGSEGCIRYVTTDDDIDQVGSWRFQGEVTLPEGTYRTDVECFRVHAPLLPAT